MYMTLAPIFFSFEYYKLDLKQKLILFGKMTTETISNLKLSLDKWHFLVLLFIIKISNLNYNLVLLEVTYIKT